MATFAISSLSRKSLVADQSAEAEAVADMWLKEVIYIGVENSKSHEALADKNSTVDPNPSVRILDEELARLMLIEKEADKVYKKKSLGNCQNFCGHF